MRAGEPSPEPVGIWIPEVLSVLSVDETRGEAGDARDGGGGGGGDSGECGNVAEFGVAAVVEDDEKEIGGRTEGCLDYIRITWKEEIKIAYP